MDTNGSVKLADFGLAKVLVFCSLLSPFTLRHFSSIENGMIHSFLALYLTFYVCIILQATKLNDVKSCKGTAFWMAPEV